MLEGTFKNGNLRTASKMTFEHAYLTTLDLEDALFMLPIHCSSEIHSRFQFKKEPDGVCHFGYAQSLWFPQKFLIQDCLIS